MIFLHSLWISPVGSNRIIIIWQDGNEVFFKVKKSTPLRKLMDAYCKRQGVSEADVVFLFDGSRLKTDQTPEQVSYIFCAKHTSANIPNLA
jgi:hypothetical protein